MDTEQAKISLLKHSFMWQDVDDPKVESGFLGSLRPYQGLREENFHEVMEAIRAYASILYTGQVDSQVIGALWCICYLGKIWGLDAEGMLQSNRLISREDTETLNGWINAIGYAVMILLDSDNVEEAFAGYEGRTDLD